MTDYLCVSVTPLDCLYHGKADHGEPEWPPSPLRLFQAMLRGVRTGCRNMQWVNEKAAAFKWLERCEPPLIVTPQVSLANEYTLFVPNNDSDKQPERQNRLTSKVARPHHLPDDIEHRTLHYLWRINDANDSSALDHAELLRDESRHLLALGWGIDQAVANGRLIIGTEAQKILREGVTWRPLTGQHQTNDARRVPTKGTLRDLEKVYETFINRVDGRRYTPPLKPSAFKKICYVQSHVFPTRPHVVFEIRNNDGTFCRYPQRKLVHIAGMVRHLAIKLMKKSPPEDVDNGWVQRYVAGHRGEKFENHSQLSYLPLPSIGHPHADHSVRRVMIAAPIGDESWLEHLANRLNGQLLRPEQGDEFGEQGPPVLIRVYHDQVAARYTRPARLFGSVTPVILPGHDDHKPDKRKKLIEKALAQSGVEQSCSFEWGVFSRWHKSLSAYKYDRDKKPIGFIRPGHLITQTTTHLVIRFDDAYVSGPIVVGAGRHCGFGLMAALDG